MSAVRRAAVRALRALLRRIERPEASEGAADPPAAGEPVSSLTEVERIDRPGTPALLPRASDEESAEDVERWYREHFRWGWPR